MPKAQRKLAGTAGRAIARELGIPRFFQAASGALFDAQLAERKAALENRYWIWHHDVSGFLSRVSIARRKLPLNGESHKLLNRLENAGSAARLEVRIRRVLSFLQSLPTADLIFNHEIPAYMRALEEQEERDRRERVEARLLDLRGARPGFERIQLPDREAIRRRLADHPDVLETVESIFNAALRDGPDDKRSALASCRVALEVLGRKVTRRSEWREAVKQVADEDVQATFRKVYSLLSAKGSHGTKKPTQADLELGIHQTLGCLFWLLANETELSMTRGKPKQG